MSAVEMPRGKVYILDPAAVPPQADWPFDLKEGVLR